MISSAANNAYTYKAAKQGESESQTCLPKGEGLWSLRDKEGEWSEVGVVGKGDWK